MFSRKLIFGILYGLATGLAFSVTAWGIDAWLLAGAHWAYPWVSFLPGLLAALLLGGLAGGLSMGLEHILARLGVWLFVGLMLGFLSTWLPWGFAPRVVLLLEPALQGWVMPFDMSSADRLTLFCIAVTVVPALLAGALEHALVEQASFSPGDGAILFPVALAMFLFALPGLATDNAVNAKLREAAVNLGKSLTFAIENREREVGVAEARQMYLGAVRPIENQLTARYRLFYFSTEDLFEQNRILVESDGQWSVCLLVAGNLIHCQPVVSP